MQHKQCPKCERMFNNMQGYWSHLRMAHGISSDGTVVEITRTPEEQARYEKGVHYRELAKLRKGQTSKSSKIRRSSEPTAPVMIQTKSPKQDTIACFCPKCGTNIAAVNMALKLAQ